MSADRAGRDGVGDGLADTTGDVAFGAGAHAPAAVSVPEPADREHWNGAGVRRLRGYLGDSQAGLAGRLGTRQQTVSEWETGVSRPRRMSRRLLRLVAEESGYYAAGADEFTDETSAGSAGGPSGTPGAAP